MQDPLNLGADAGPKTMGLLQTQASSAPHWVGAGWLTPSDRHCHVALGYARGRSLLGSPQAPLSATRHSGLRVRVALEQGHLSVRCLLAVVIIIWLVIIKILIFIPQMIIFLVFILLIINKIIIFITQIILFFIWIF